MAKRRAKRTRCLNCGLMDWSPLHDTGGQDVRRHEFRPQTDRMVRSGPPERLAVRLTQGRLRRAVKARRAEFAASRPSRGRWGWRGS